MSEMEVLIYLGSQLGAHKCHLAEAFSSDCGCSRSHTPSGECTVIGISQYIWAPLHLATSPGRVGAVGEKIRHRQCDGGFAEKQVQRRIRTDERIHSLGLTVTRGYDQSSSLRSKYSYTSLSVREINWRRKHSCKIGARVLHIHIQWGSTARH